MYIRIGQRVFTLMAPTKEKLINLQPCTITSQTDKTTLGENGDYVYTSYYGVTPEGSQTEILIPSDEVAKFYFEEGYDIREMIDAEIAKLTPKTEEK